MLEHILIIALAALVVILSASIIYRWRRAKGAILLDEKAINELISAVVENAKAGKIPDIAERVSIILRDYLKCSKIAFLKINKQTLELNHSSGLGNLNQQRLSIPLSSDLQNKLKTIARVTELSALDHYMPQESMQIFKNLGFNYFFSVFLRNNLFGIYFIKTSLSPANASLKFLTTALAFSLSAAYHIRQQDKQLKKYENRLRLTNNSKIGITGGQAISGNEFSRYLKIKNSQDLISELTRTLRKECDLDKVAFYAKSEDNNETVIGVSYQLKDNVDKSLRENHDLILENLVPGTVCSKEDFIHKAAGQKSHLTEIPFNEIAYLASVPWINKRRALMVWNDPASDNDINAYLQSFWREAAPLVEHISRFEKAKEMSYTDGLTGVYNFRYFKRRLVEEYQRATRYGRTLALLILDVDDLKVINDNYGHQAGDELLKSLAGVLSDSIRAIDLISRYGGDEFCLIMPETSRNRARLFMDRIRKRIASNPIWIDGVPGEHQYSVSIGGAVYPVDADSVDELIRTADRALLQAKSEGRNCSLLFEPEFDNNISRGK